MTLTILPKDPTVDALEAVWTSLRGLLADLPPDDWKRSTPLPGWDVQAVVAHVIGTEAMLLGIPQPDVAVDREQRAYVRNDIGTFNEQWVIAHADTPPSELLAILDDHLGRRREALRALPQADWEAESFTPAGRDSYGRFMRIRVFDTWLHEQDIRDAVDRPGHEAGIAVDATLDEMTAAMGYLVGKRAGVPAGTSVTFELTGGSGRSIHVDVPDRARVVDQLIGPATVHLTMPVGVFTRLCAGRVAPADVAAKVAVTGDDALGREIIANLAYTI